MAKLQTNIYRVTNKKGCDNCPFRDNGKAMLLRDGRVDGIKAMLLESDQNSFNCHKTVYSDDPNQKPMMCAGAYEFLKEHGKPNIQMRLAFSMGIEEFEDE